VGGWRWWKLFVDSMPDFRNILVKLSALRGDVDLEEFLEKRYPDLAALHPSAHPGSDAALEAERAWLNRSEKRHSAEKSWMKRCLHKLSKELSTFEQKQERHLGQNHAGGGGFLDAFKQAGVAEGPIVCAGLHAQIRGTRFEGTWLARDGPGLYLLGDEPLKIAVQADLDTGELLVHGYFEGRSLHETREKLVKFMEERGFKAAPGRVRDANDDDDLFGCSAPCDAASVERRSRSPKRIESPLPPGWRKRESRSKPGTFYYVHETTWCRWSRLLAAKLVVAGCVSSCRFVLVDVNWN
jgi:hypothetical protein